jgi:hypothetical protein
MLIGQQRSAYEPETNTRGRGHLAHHDRSGTRTVKHSLSVRRASLIRPEPEPQHKEPLPLRPVRHPLLPIVPVDNPVTTRHGQQQNTCTPAPPCTGRRRRGVWSWRRRRRHPHGTPYRQHLHHPPRWLLWRSFPHLREKPPRFRAEASNLCVRLIR